MSVLQTQVSNKLLLALSPRAFASIADDLSAVSLPLHHKLAVPRKARHTVVFPDSGVASVVGNADGVWQEIGLFGREGAGCLSPLLSRRPSPNLVVMQLAGEGHQIDADVLRSAFNCDDEIRELLLAYTEAFTFQMSQTAIANVQRNASQRLARWLLMIQDRIEHDRLCLTHEYVAAMLGIARTSITLALQELESQKVITTGRKLIQVDDRSKLLEIAGTFYGAPERDYIDIMDARACKWDAA